MSNKITKDEFWDKNHGDLEDPAFLNKKLLQAYEAQNADAVENILYIGFAYNLFSKQQVPILCDLLVEKWHVKHEDIVFLLQKLKSPESVEYIYKVITAVRTLI